MLLETPASYLSIFSLGKNSTEIYSVICLKRCRYNPPMIIATFGIKTVIQNSSMIYILTTAITINEAKHPPHVYLYSDDALQDFWLRTLYISKHY